MPRVDLARDERTELKERGRQHGLAEADRVYAALRAEAELTDERADVIQAVSMRRIAVVVEGLRAERIKPTLARKYERAALAAYQGRLLEHRAAEALSPSTAAG